MPSNCRSGQRASSARMSAAPRRSPDASPATIAIRVTRATSPQDAAGGGGEEFRERADLGGLGGLALELGARVGQAQSRLVQGAVGALERGDRLGREAT